MADIASRLAKSVSMWSKRGQTSSRAEVVSRVMAMLAILETWNTEIVIFASFTSNECVFIKYCDIRLVIV
jgi:hypothetical protein